MNNNDISDDLNDHMSEYSDPNERNKNSSNNELAFNEKVIHNLPKINVESLASDDKGKLDEDKAVTLIVENVLKAVDNPNLGLCADHNYFFYYNGKGWDYLDERELKKLLVTCAVVFGIQHLTTSHYGFISKMLKQFISTADPPEAERSMATYLCLQNGILRIYGREVTFLEHDKKYFLKYCLPYSYDPAAKSPRFDKFLSEVLPNREVRLALAEFVGYCLVPNEALSLEKMAIALGNGNNGKSVFSFLVVALLGSKNVTNYSLGSITDQHGYYRSMLNGKYLNISFEMNDIKDKAMFKTLASGEPVEARLPHGRPFIMRKYSRLMVNANSLGKDVEITDGFFRRYLIFPFNVKIKEEDQDKELASTIIKFELGGILNWAIEGLQRLMFQQRFTEASEMGEALKQYIEDSDSVRQFVIDHNFSHSDRPYALKGLYQKYAGYCEELGFKAVNATNLRKRMETIGFTVKRMSIGWVIFTDHGASLSAKEKEDLLLTIFIEMCTTGKWEPEHVKI